MALQDYRAEVTKQSIAAAFWVLSKFVASVRPTAVPLTAFFGSTYLREEAFSQMKTAF